MFCGGPFAPSSETQGQIVGARESLNGWKNMARRKVKNGEKSPCGQCLTRPVPNGHRRSGFWFVPENFCVFLPNQKPEWRRPFGTGVVRHCPQGLFSPFFTFLRAIFFCPFRLSLAPTICSWVSEDGKGRVHAVKIMIHYQYKFLGVIRILCSLRRKNSFNYGIFFLEGNRNFVYHKDFGRRRVT